MSANLISIKKTSSVKNSLRGTRKFLIRRAVLIAAATTAVTTASRAGTGTATNTSGPVQQGNTSADPNYYTDTGAPFTLNNPAVTISFSGQTALRNFFTTAGVSLLQPGTSITLHDGTGGTAVTYTATNNDNTLVQLANPNFTTPDLNPGSPGSPSAADAQTASAIQLQWHEQGSIDGFVDLLNDQAGFVQVAQGGTGPLSNPAARGPSSSNPTWINTNKFTAAGSANGFTLNAAASNATPVYGTLSDIYNTYDTTVYTPATGANLLGGQNRVQFSVGEYPTEALAVTGTASVFATAGSAGYGQGNPALNKASNLTGLGVGNTKQQFQPNSIANLSTTKINPQTGALYPTGPWNTAGTDNIATATGADNITSVPFAATAVTYSANPGTGLTEINKNDAQWLQTTGRLQNGALFNVVARTVNTGQRAVFALNSGVDPSWAVGSNDNGNSTSTANANAQHSIGTSLRFDGKTSGTEAEKTIAQSRMSLGALSVPEARAAASNAPVRSLNVDFNDLTDPTVGGNIDSSRFIGANFNSIVSSDSTFRYQAVLISHFNTVKAPNTNLAGLSSAAWANVQSFNSANPGDASVSGIKGDTKGTIGNFGPQASNTTGDVAAFLSNIVNSIGTAGAGLTPSSLSDPADSLYLNGFLTPNILNWTRTTDGGAITPVTLNSNAFSLQQSVSTNYGYLFTTDLSAGAHNETIGSAATYGAGNSAGPAVNGAIPITAKNADGSAAANGAIAPAGNYLFGNFNQTGVRDFSAVQQSVNAALSLYAVDSASGGANNIFTGATNSTPVSSLVGTPAWVTTGTNSKGDLITLGDYNGDGAFDGQDLYLLATGAALADSTNTATLSASASSFADVVRNPNIVLRKNAALDYVSNYLNVTSYTAGATFLRRTGRSVLTGAVPSGATDLGSTDPVTGLEQFTYDPTGLHAFDKHDVNRDGVVDFNDAVLVDQYNGSTYHNLTQSLAATQKAPVTGATLPVSLVAVQQVDGEVAIGAGDLTELNSALTGTGNANWYGYSLQKAGPGTIDYERTGGTNIVYASASFEISAGAVKVGGSLDPFSDNTAGATAGNHVAVTVDHGALLQLVNGATSTVTSLTLDLASGSKVDLGTGSLTLSYSSLANPNASIRGYISNAYNVSGTPWTGPAGITSTQLDAHHAVAFADGSDGVVTNLPANRSSAVPAGGVLPANNELVTYAFAGDANLDGKVDFSDFVILSNHFGGTFTNWDQGNFNYDTGVDFSDFVILSNNFGEGVTAGDGASATPIQLAQYNSLAASLGISKSQISAWDAQIAALPEPTSVSLLTLGIAGLLHRRRRRLT
ncbi:MAG: PEP-CTERM sorting domain-containing protein [Planctomycetota bacterium]|nr:PEP-CTERM sorting domain-containing protein [Planctomycetota bacterium]